jgi:hypothetical protein
MFSTDFLPYFHGRQRNFAASRKWEESAAWEAAGGSQRIPHSIMVPVLLPVAGGEFAGGQLNVAENASESADFQSTISMDRHRRTQFTLGQKMVTAADSQQIKAFALEKPNHFLAGDAR